MLDGGCQVKTCGWRLEIDARAASLPLDRKSTCNVNVHPETCAIEFDSLQTTEENICYEAL